MNPVTLRPRKLIQGKIVPSFAAQDYLAFAARERKERRRLVLLALAIAALLALLALAAFAQCGVRSAECGLNGTFEEMILARGEDRRIVAARSVREPPMCIISRRAWAIPLAPGSPKVGDDRNGGDATASAAIFCPFTPHSALRTPRLWTVTAYCPDRRCCGRWADGRTASGTRADHPLVAAPPELPFGTTLVVPGYNGGGPVKVEDRGGAIKGLRLDVLFPTRAEALAWGVKRLRIADCGVQSEGRSAE